MTDLAISNTSTPTATVRDVFNALPPQFLARKDQADRKARTLAEIAGSASKALAFLKELRIAGWKEPPLASLFQSTNENMLRKHWERVLPLHAALSKAFKLRVPTICWTIAQHIGLLNYEPDEIVEYVQSKTQSREETEVVTILNAALKGLKSKNKIFDSIYPGVTDLTNAAALDLRERPPRLALLASLHFKNWSEEDAAAYVDAFPFLPDLLMDDPLRSWPLATSICSLQKALKTTPQELIALLTEAAREWSTLLSLLKGLQLWADSSKSKNILPAVRSDADAQAFIVLIHNMRSLSIAGWHEERWRFLDDDDRENPLRFLLNLPIASAYEEVASLTTDDHDQRSNWFAPETVRSQKVLTCRELLFRAMLLHRVARRVLRNKRDDVVSALTEPNRSYFLAVLKESLQG